jgi:hypothetical protein
MNASEFATNYKKYISEIESLVGDNVAPVVKCFKRKDPLTSIKPPTVFPGELEARGFVWNKSIEVVN